MSFILDALRKAEHGRQSSPAATVTITPAEVPAAPPDTKRRALAAVASLAAVAVVAAAYWFLRPQPAEQTVSAPPATTAPAPATAAPAPSVTQSARPLSGEVETATDGARQDVRALDQEVGRADPASVPTPTPSPASRASTPTRRVTPGTVTVMSAEQMASAGAIDGTYVPTSPSAPSPGADEYAGLPEYRNLLRAGRINLPNLSLDMHVYNRVPEKRFVFVNLKKYREGDMIEGKAAVEAITANGAVLNNNGLTFLLRPD